tara:strand:- start:2475 stop:2705 length:231 start_codon:yes stop_codon:yes gene_type:complete
MKKLLLIPFLLLAVTACDNGSMFDQDTITLQADTAWRMSAAGTDVRIYEFTPRTAPHKQCVFAAAESKAGLVCFAK